MTHDKRLADKYTANWQARAKHPDPYEGQAEREGRVGSQSVTVARQERVGWLRGVEELRGLPPDVLQVGDEDFREEPGQYNTRDETVQAGKKPCAECKP